MTPKKDLLNPTTKELRQFGFLMAAVISVIFGLFLPWVFSAETFPNWPWYIAIGFALPAAIYPLSLKQVFIYWMKFGAVVGAFNSKVLLTIFYFTVITPVGFLMRLFGKDSMRKEKDTSLTSYRISRNETAPRMDKPF